MKEFTSKVDEEANVEAIRYSARDCAVTVCATLAATLFVEERIREIFSICFPRRELQLLTDFSITLLVD